MQLMANPRKRRTPLWSPFDIPCSGTSDDLRPGPDHVSDLPAAAAALSNAKALSVVLWVVLADRISLHHDYLLFVSIISVTKKVDRRTRLPSFAAVHMHSQENTTTFPQDDCGRPLGRRDYAARFKI
jgi:hypothetical protein